MTDEELIARLRKFGELWPDDHAAADRIEQLVATNEALVKALREIAAGASVPVHTGKNGINFKKMYKGWRKIAVERIDIARAALVKLGEN